MNGQERTGAARSLVDLFNSAKQKTLQGTSVATLALVSEVTRAFADGYGILEALPLPQWDTDGTNVIQGYFFSDMELAAGTLVMIIFTDTDFRDTIEMGHWQPMQTANTNTHSKNFGVVIKL